MELVGVVVDNSDAGYGEPLGTWADGTGGWNGELSRFDADPVENHAAQWVATGLDPAVTYDVEARWLNGDELGEANVYHDTSGRLPNQLQLPV